METDRSSAYRLIASTKSFNSRTWVAVMPVQLGEFGNGYDPFPDDFAAVLSANLRVRARSD